MTYGLTLAGLLKCYSGVAALDNFSFQFSTGVSYGLIGPNGAGKTTLLNVVSGFVLPDRGTVHFRGVDITRRAPHERYEFGIVRSFQENRLARGLTVIDNLMLGIHDQKGDDPLSALLRPREVYRSNERTRHRGLEILNRFGLSHLATKAAGTLSYGQQKIVGVLCCLACAPKLVLFDEPATGLSPSLRHDLALILRNYFEAGQASAIIVEHDLEFIGATTSLTLFMSAGRLVAWGPLDEIRQNKDVLSSYLAAGKRGGRDRL